jgi:hypothetical protein
LAALVWVVGCATPNPLAGWHFSNLDNLRSNPAITADCHDYVQKLPSRQKGFIDSVDYFEDGTGQHAVDIKIVFNGTRWEHVLIYNKENKRIKVIKHKSSGSTD